MERREKANNPKRKVLMTALALVLVCAMVIGIVAVVGAGNVGRDNEVSGDLWADLDQEVCLISTKEDLLRWAKNPNGEEYKNKVIALGADITFNAGKSAADWASAAPAEKWFPVASFNGTFDGRGFTVSGLYAVTGGNSGFFADLTKGAVVRNLSIKNSYFKGTGCVAALAGGFRSCTVTNVYSDAIVECANHGGGILGYQSADGDQKSTAYMSSCWFDGSLTMTGSYGSGILGNQSHNYAVITDCLNTGSVTADYFAGGISVAVYEGALTASRCLNLGELLQTKDSSLGYALTSTVGSNSKAADGPVQYVNCYGKASVSDVEIPDVRQNSVVDGEVIALADNFTAEDVKGLSGYWKMEGSTPVPAYFASPSATEIPSEPVTEFAPTVSVENAAGVVTGTVQVQVKLKSNPGISDLKLKLTYDSSILTLVGVENGLVLNGASLPNSYDNPYGLQWSTDADSTLEGVLATLTFKVADVAAGQKAVIGVSYAEANNAAGEAVTLKSADGTVETLALQKGDLNRDNVIDANDVTLLLKYLAGEGGLDIVVSSADVDSDMDVDQKDADLLAAYVAGQSVTLG